MQPIICCRERIRDRNGERRRAQSDSAAQEYGPCHFLSGLDRKRENKANKGDEVRRASMIGIEAKGTYPQVEVLSMRGKVFGR